MTPRKGRERMTKEQPPNPKAKKRANLKERKKRRKVHLKTSPRGRSKKKRRASLREREAFQSRS